MVTQRGLWIEEQRGQVAARALFRQANAASLAWVPLGEWQEGASGSVVV